MPDLHPPSPEDTLNDFLISVERRAFKRAAYAVRDDDAALDIVQDAMIRLSQSYADRPETEWPMLFQRILSNAILDWFRRQKTRNAVFTNMGDLEARFSDEDGDFDDEKYNQFINELHQNEIDERIYSWCDRNNYNYTVEEEE